jgi:hypothetical protein
MVHAILHHHRGNRAMPIAYSLIRLGAARMCTLIVRARPSGQVRA